VTQPRQARQSSGDGPRIYPWPPQPPHEFEVISVTSALKGGLPKPFLIGWAAKMSAEFAVDNLGVIQTLVESDQKRAAIDLIKNARNRDRDAKASRGTVVHAAIESYLAGTPLSSEDIAARLEEERVPEALSKQTAAMVQGLRKFLDDFEPEIIWSEATVYSRTHGYAGTTDIIGRLHIGDSRVPCVIDVKTSKAIYNEVALQLCGYARADFVGLDDGTEKPLMQNGERIEWGMVVRPTPGGSYEHGIYALTDELYERFLAILAVAKSEGLESQVRRPS
jgi:hypothetical protein